MIASAVALYLAQAAPAAQPSFAFMCKVEGTLAPKSTFSAFPEPRKFALLVRKDNGSFAPLRTFDPSSLLSGRQITMFHKSDGGALSYGGFTSLPSADAGAMIISFTPSESKKFNEWKIAIGEAKRTDGKVLTVGRCLLMDGVSESGFGELTGSLGSDK